MRPEGLENPYPNVVDVPFLPEEMITTTQTMMHKAWEAGADAMLEGLKKGGKYFETLDAFVQIGGEVIVPRHSKGCLVFIQEEKG